MTAAIGDLTHHQILLIENPRGGRSWGLPQRLTRTAGGNRRCNWGIRGKALAALENVSAAKASPSVCDLHSLNKKRDMLARFFRVSHNRSAALRAGVGDLPWPRRARCAPER